MPTLLAAESEIAARRWAAEAQLQNLGAEHIPAYIGLLDHPDEVVRFAAVQRLAEFPEAVPMLQREIHAPSARRRQFAELALFDEHRPPELRWQTALVALADPNAECRIGAIGAISMLCWPAELDDLRHNYHSSHATSAVLAALEKHHQAGVRGVLRALEDREAAVREKACRALLFMPFAREAALPQVLRHMRDRNYSVRLAAAELFEFYPASVVPELAKLALSVNWSVADPALIALSKMGPRARAAIPALVSNIRTRRAGSIVLLDSANALGSIGDDAIPTMLQLLEDPQPNAWWAAHEAFMICGLDAAIGPLLRYAEESPQSASSV